jgi:uncharacterized membrane protein
MKKAIFTLFSYLSAFTYGGYTYGYFHGHKPEAHQWVIAGLFGIMFYLMAQEEK